MTTPTVRRLDVAEGIDVPQPSAHALLLDGEHHQGLQDSRCHDQDSIDLTQPLRRELTLGLSVMIHIQSLIRALLGAVLIQYDICKDLRAVQAGAAVQRREAERAFARADGDVGAALKLVPADRPDLLAEAQVATGRTRDAVIAFVKRWFPMTVFAALEAVANYLAMLYLRDDEWATWVIAGASTAAIIGGCYYIAQSTSRLRSIGLGICVAAVVIGSGVLRYRYAVDQIVRGLAKSDPPLGDWTKLAIFVFALGLPAAFGMITIAKTRPEPGADEAMAERSKETTIVAGIRRLQEIAEQRRTELRAATETDTEATDALRNAEAALGLLCDQTETAVIAEAGRRVERLDVYFRGLALGASDPAVTTRLDRRYANAVLALGEQVGRAVQEALKQVTTVRAGLLTFEPSAPTVSSTPPCPSATPMPPTPPVSPASESPSETSSESATAAAAEDVA